MSATTAVAEEVQALEGLDLEGLRSAWRRRYGPPPKLRSVEILRLALAWRIQAAACGGLDAISRRRLRTGSGAPRAEEVSDGTRIIKVWRGETHVVERITDGFRWRGKTYSSLSKLALAISDVKRNGPKFFGLREGGPG